MPISNAGAVSNTAKPMRKDRFSRQALQLAQKPVIDTLAPYMFCNPPAEYQARFCGASMQHAFLFGAAFCNVMMNELTGIYGPSFEERFKDDFHLLDFGCGWGRIIRLLALKYPAVRIFGCDVNSNALEYAAVALPRGSFAKVSPLPPSPYRDQLFSLVVSVSVFSHLNIDNHRAWVAELARIVVPGGVVVITLHGPWFLDMIVDLATGVRPIETAWHRALAGHYERVREDRARVSKAEGFLFLPTMSIHSENDYGDCMIERHWIEHEWNAHGFALRSWVSDNEYHPQIVAVMERHAI